MSARLSWQMSRSNVGPREWGGGHAQLAQSAQSNAAAIEVTQASRKRTIAGMISSDVLAALQNAGQIVKPSAFEGSDVDIEGEAVVPRGIVNDNPQVVPTVQFAAAVEGVPRPEHADASADSFEGGIHAAVSLGVFRDRFDVLFGNAGAPQNVLKRDRDGGALGIAPFRKLVRVVHQAPFVPPTKLGVDFI